MKLEDTWMSCLFVRGHDLFTWTTVGTRDIIRWLPLTEGEPRLVGTMEVGPAGDIDGAGVHFTYAHSRSRNVYMRWLKNWASPPRLVAAHPADITGIAFHPDGQQLAASDKSGGIRIWPTAARAERPLRVLEAQGTALLRYSPGGSWLTARNYSPNLVRLFDLSSPLSSEPLLLRGPSQILFDLAFEPSARWLAAANDAEIALWPLGERYPRSLGRYEWYVDDVAFTPDGSSLVSVSGGQEGVLRARSLSVEEVESERILLREWLDLPRMAVDPRGERVAVSTASGQVVVVPLAGGATRRLEGFSARTEGNTPVAFSPDGRRLAAAPTTGPAEEKVVRVWDLESGGGRVLGHLPGAGEGSPGAVSALSFLDDGHIVTSSLTSGILVFDLREGGHTVLSSRPARAVVVGHRERVVFAVVGAPDELVRINLDGQAPARVFSCPGCASVALDPTGTVVATGSAEGIVRVGPASGGEPHLFFSQIGSVQRVAFSPDGRWVASSGERPSVRLWPVPDVTRTPLHRRSQEELLATLHSWTNLRAAKDPQSPTGWKLEPGPFPGWEALPHW
ncbi:MAG TPA: WD40 repeat domain-containing protein [Vicinamibacteria bacterium]|nr:WD40 repeat domain-containing protein [Vicinamibacteria bacterium]